MAAGAAGCAFGGQETYGQTVWLTEGPSREATYWWGMAGLAVKGGAWIGLTGLWLGMAAGHRRYRLAEVAALGAGMLAAGVVGTWLVNRPFAPPGQLPALYFSNFVSPADPANPPRPECWGGLWLGLLAAWAYVTLVKRDTLASRLAGWGVLGGAIGFPAAQAFNVWQAAAQPVPAAVGRWVDWWKVVEMGFGLIAGLALGVGAWRARHLLPAGDSPQQRVLPLPARAALLLAGVAVLPALEGGLLPPSLQDFPFGPWLVPAVLAFADAPLAWVVGLGLPLVLNGQDLACGHLAREMKLISPEWAWGAWAVGSLAALGLAWRWGRQEEKAPGTRAPAALAAGAGIPAVMASAKLLANPAFTTPGLTLGQRLAGSPVTVVAGFLGLAAALSLWRKTR